MSPVFRWHRGCLKEIPRTTDVAATLRKLAEKKSFRNALIIAYVLFVLVFSATAKAAAVRSFSKVGPVAQSTFLDPLPVPDLSTVAVPEVFCKVTE